MEVGEVGNVLEGKTPNEVDWRKYSISLATKRRGRISLLS